MSQVPLRVTVVPPELSDGPAIVTRAAIDHDRAVHFRALALPDTVYVGDRIEYPPVPSFAPEHFRTATAGDIGRYKQFRKGIEQLDQEVGHLLGGARLVLSDGIRARLVRCVATIQPPPEWTTK